MEKVRIQNDYDQDRLVRQISNELQGPLETNTTTTSVPLNLWSMKSLAKVLG